MPAVPGVYWPPKPVPCAVTIDAFVLAFETQRYVECASPNEEDGLEKIALYQKNGMPSHAAKQTKGGLWTSKLGAWETIEHELDALTGNGPNEYGAVVKIFSRKSL